MTNTHVAILFVKYNYVFIKLIEKKIVINKIKIYFMQLKNDQVYVKLKMKCSPNDVPCFIRSFTSM
jgi:hypothetical protein